jgi:hypothetical protein
MRLALLILAASVQAAAAAQPATLRPPETGSMYNGNNARPPRQTERESRMPDQSAGTHVRTGAEGPGGRGARHGGGG